MSKSTKILNNLKAALEWAEAGFYVFPCVPNTKIPLIPADEGGRGLYDATRDAGQITAWWMKCPEANIGASPHASGHVVLDVDDKGNKHGSDTLQGLELIHGNLPETFAIETPTGGRHLWFLGDEKSSIERMGPGLDTRGRGGYVLLPGSTCPDGRYTTLRDAQFADVPPWINATLSYRSRDSENAVSEELDTPANIARAIAYLERCVVEGDVSIEGSGGDDTLYKISAMLHDIGVSEETAIGLLLEHWNEECSPPWAEGELTDETHSPVYHAFEYAQNEAGSKGLRDNVATFTGITRNGASVNTGSGHKERNQVLEGKDAPVSGVASQQRGCSRFRLRNEQEQDNRPPPEWIIPGWIQEASTVLLYAPPESFKSFVALDLALSFAGGKKALGIDYQPTMGYPVVYAAGEGAIAIETLRRPAWKSHRRVAKDVPFYSVSDVPTAGEDPTEINEFIEQIDAEGIKPALIVFDTLSYMMTGMDENSAKDASLLVKRVNEIRNNYNCVVIVVHHTGKDGKAERGSSAFRGNFDTLITCHREQDSDVVEVVCTKQKDAAKPKSIALKAYRVMDGLALSPHVVKEEIHKDKKDDPFVRERNIVHKVLTEGGHTNRGNALSSKALADLYLREAGEMPDDPHEASSAIEAKKNALNRKAKGVLKSYTVSDFGDTPLWAVSPE